MLRNYIKIAWRNLLKNKVYSTINISGLGIGMACCFLIFMYVKHELSFDQYHENKDAIYRVVHGYEESSDSKAIKLVPEDYEVWGNAPVAMAMKQDFPEIDKVVRFSGRADILFRKDGNIFQEDGAFFTDSTVFEVFSWDLVKGNPQIALKAPYSIVLTESTAKKYFGDEEALGKTLQADASPGRASAGLYTVTGIIKDIPENSHFSFNVLLSMSTFQSTRPSVFDSWGYVDFYTYFLAKEQFDPSNFQQKVPEFLSRHANEQNQNYSFEIEGLNDIYLHSVAARQPGKTGSLENLYIFSVIGFFILLIAIINFMNLSTARSMDRAKEVGIRKTIGADKKGLIFQFLGESSIIVVIASILAIVLVGLSMPFISQLTGKELVISQFITWKSFPLYIGIVLFIGLLAGSYPSFILSSFKPAAILRGSLNKKSGGVALRKGLVVFQFTLSIVLITSTIIVYSQIGHVLDKSMGFDKEQMLLVDYNYDGAVNDKQAVLKEQMEALPSVVSFAAARSVPGKHFPQAGTGIEINGGELEFKVQPIFEVNIDFIKQFDLEVVAGRAYSRDFPADDSTALIINRAAARQYGYTNPEEIIGKKFIQWGREGSVIGVVENFNYVSLHQKIEPLTLRLAPFECRYLVLKVKSDDLPKTIAAVGAVFQGLAPHRPFSYSFLDDDFNQQYQADFKFRELFTSFSILAIFISCLGLLGLATYTAEVRTKEIGIRKVMGAKISTIVGLLSKDFVKLVAVAIILATPLSWYIMSQWLEDFAYKVSLSWWMFAISGALAFAIAMITISFQSIKVARMNPVASLKSE
jgi:putative ABC transport system permease protein